MGRTEQLGRTNTYTFIFYVEADNPKTRTYLKEGYGESHGGLQEGGVEDGTTRTICSRRKGIIQC